MKLIPIPHLGKNLFFCLSGKAKAKMRGSMDYENLHTWLL